MACPASLARLFGHLPICLLDTSLDGCHLEVISFGSGCHVPNNSHLVTWGLDTASIGDLHCCEVERWSLGRVVRLSVPDKLAGAVFETCLRGDLDLAGLACTAREAIP